MYMYKHMSRHIDIYNICVCRFKKGTVAFQIATCRLYISRMIGLWKNGYFVYVDIINIHSDCSFIE